MAVTASKSLLLLSQSGRALSSGFSALGVTRHRHHQHHRTASPTLSFAHHPVRRLHGLRSEGRSALIKSTNSPLPVWQSQRLLSSTALPPEDGTRVASSTGIDILLLDDFKLVINDTTHHVRPPKRDHLAHEDAQTLGDVKMLVQQLYTTLRIEEHQLHKERQLIGRLENLNSQILPFEKLKEELSRKAEKRATWVMWGGMAYMATQFGILARLTWWEYSWDIMEPVTYFITYGSSMAMYAYFVLTRQEYIYPDARDRQYLLFFHKGAKKNRFDIEKYNQLKDAIAEAELDLKRLRDPLQLQLPIQQISGKKD
ncbi:calcium uniporter protein, mitochondrial-like isoform X3 [Polyodon spathula]|uniref:calcium uniporter protein, mitochondrial-like isoform X3 n=1 Tax=Polyodon spathula TaxID=7913 RepID=UPI001B7F5FF2|nr:calcium uniporter protein, mitochondrial-like isoform X3 [Polyodon spathula]